MASWDHFYLDTLYIQISNQNSDYRPVTNTYSHTAQISPGRSSLHEPLFVSDGFTIRSVIVNVSLK